MTSNTWETVLLGELCTFTKGSSPTLKTLPGEYPLIVTGPEPLSSADYQFEGEAVCVPMVSSTGHGHASLKRVHYASGRFAVANIVTACEVKKPAECSTRFLHIYLQHFKDELIVPRMQGTANVSLSQRELAQVPVALPPLEDQRRIVDLIVAVDDAIDAMQEASARNKESFNAIAESLPGQLTLLDEVLLAIEAGKSPSGVERKPAPGERAVLKVSAIGSGTFNAMEVKVVSPDTRLDEKTAISRGDVLMVRANGVIKRVGAVCQVRGDYEQLYLCDKTLRLVPDPDRLDSRWLNSALSSTQSRRQIEALTTGSHMRNITQRAIRQIKIPLPDIDEQATLSAALESLIEARDALDSHTDTLAALRTELLSAVLSGGHRIPATYDELMGA